MSHPEGKFDQIVATESIRRSVATAEQREHDAATAREFVMAAQDPTSQLYRQMGPDRLLAAAQVYATLSTR